MADLLTSGQMQELLQVDRTTIYRMVEDGRLPAIRVGKQWRFEKLEIERWLQARASQSGAAPATAQAPGQPATPAGAESPVSPPLSAILPVALVQPLQDVFAEMLGVMIAITDMQGHPLTQISNPCAYFVAATQRAGGASACARTWQGLAESVALEPRYAISEVGLLCTRGLIRTRSELSGMLVLGGIAPEVWPPSHEQLLAIATSLSADVGLLEANVDAVHRLDRVQREKALRFAQRIADVFSHVVEDRSLIQSKLQAIALLAAC
jgi:excisionase family DNA binding protein